MQLDLFTRAHFQGVITSALIYEVSFTLAVM